MKRRVGIPGHWIMFACLAAVGALCMPARVFTQQGVWRPPLGIPEPEFGIREQAPAAPANWTNPAPGFYYVDASRPGASDANNPFGSPASPRASVPEVLPAGSVVELRGRYDIEHTGRDVIRVQGTKDKPVFIRGDDRNSVDVVRPWEVSGSYFVLEHLRFHDRDGVTTGSLALLAPVNHAAVRNSEVSGNLRAGGFAIEGWTGATATQIVVYGNRIHDNGDVKANFDQDRHGIHIGERVNTVWIVDNEMWRNSGDGIQISARWRSLEAQTHHIYVGRNVSHHNKQNGFWTKQATDVIFSQNVTYANRPSNSSLGVGLGFQYAPSWVWFLSNEVYDSDFGIQGASDSDLGTGTESFYIGNVIHDIHDSGRHFNPETAWHNCGISLAGGVNRYIVNNTLFDVDSGICSAGAVGKLEIDNNIVFKIRRDGQHVFIEHPNVAGASQGGAGNLFGPIYRLRVGGTQRTYDKEKLGVNSVVRDPGFLLTRPWPFDLAASAPAIDRGSDNAERLFALYRGRYGQDISRDFAGRPRRSGQQLDAGAFEHQTAVPERRK